MFNTFILMWDGFWIWVCVINVRRWRRNRKLLKELELKQAAALEDLKRRCTRDRNQGD